MAATKLWEKVLQAVESLPRHDSEILSDLNVLLSSGLESRRKATVNITIKTWNNIFGKQETLSYPSRVRTALAKLRSITDLSLPGFPEDDSGVFTPPEFADSQDAENTQSVPDMRWSSPTPARQLFPSSRTLPSTPANVVMETPSRGRRNNHTSTPMKGIPKPKHMDSQLDFVAIEGAPSLETQDSQLITEHQKEVREEQAQAAVMFPELVISTPTTKKREIMKVGSESPTANRRDQLPIGSPISGHLDRVPETTTKGSAKAPEFMVSFISESNIGSRSPSVSSTVRRKGSNEPGIHKDTSTELTDFDSSGDTRMADYSETSMEKPAHKPPADLLPEELSEDEAFVDAPDHFPRLGVGNPAEPSPVREKERITGRTKDTSEIAVVIPLPRKNEDHCASASTSMPDTSTPVAYGRIAPGTPNTRPQSNRKRAKKRKRPHEPKPSPALLDTAEDAAESMDSPMASSPPPAPVSLKIERPLKRVKGADTDGIPAKTRVSARKNKGRRPARGLVSAIAPSENDLDEGSGASIDFPAARVASTDTKYPEEHVPSPTPMRTRNASKRVRTPQKAAVEKDASFVVETQLAGFSFSVADSQLPTSATKASSTPTRGRRAKGLFANDEHTDELQVRSPKHSLSEADSSGVATPRPARRSKRRSKLSMGMEMGATTLEVEKGREKEVEAEEEERGNEEQSVSTSPPAATALKAIRKALELVDGADMTVTELATVEDEMFEAFRRLREKKREAKQ